MQKAVAIFLLIVLAILLFVKSYERDRLIDWAKWRVGQVLDWVEDKSPFARCLIGAAILTALTIFFTWLTADFIHAWLMWMF